MAQAAQLVLYGDLDWRDGGAGREAHEGGDMCTHIADSLFCIAETSKTLHSNYTLI